MQKYTNYTELENISDSEKKADKQHNNSNILRPANAFKYFWNYSTDAHKKINTRNYGFINGGEYCKKCTLRISSEGNYRLLFICGSLTGTKQRQWNLIRLIKWIPKKGRETVFFSATFVALLCFFVLKGISTSTAATKTNSIYPEFIIKMK